MPIERRSASRQTTVLVFSVVALLVAIGLVVAVVRSAGRTDAPTVRGPQQRFDAGLAEERAAAIAEDGPLLFSDVSGAGQRLPVFVSHAGEDPTTGWNVIAAHPPDTPDDCFLEWDRDREVFAAPCIEETYPADGGALPHYPWTVTDDGRLLIDLRRPTS